MNALTEALVGFLLNLVIVVVIVRFIYYPQQRDKHFVFTFVGFNTVVFFVMGLLNDSALSIGAGFGLFAIFSIFRYRTDTIPIREMTYLFVLTALPVMNSILLPAAAYEEFALVNIAVVTVLFVLEKGWGFSFDVRKTIVYERIELTRPENWSLLLADLQERTGLPIKRVEIGELNFLRDTAQITIYFDARAVNPTSVGFSVASIAVADDD
ncbi:MAG: DUF4956 domain-containing protein [Anaerolineae bacterium]|nr:DUF4956 domain-containing protein [Anaerolineae bacterium]